MYKEKLFGAVLTIEAILALKVHESKENNQYTPDSHSEKQFPINESARTMYNIFTYGAVYHDINNMFQSTYTTSSNGAQLATLVNS